MKRFVLMIVGACAAFPVSASAQEATASYSMLPCHGACGNFTPAKITGQYDMNYPPQYRGGMDVYVEAIIETSFKVGVDGKAREIVIERQMGPDPFAEDVRRALEKMVFKPATHESKPIESTLRESFGYTLILQSPDDMMAREYVANKYGRGRTAVRNGKPTEAIAILEDALTLEKMNLYERCMIENLLAYTYYQINDYQEALQHIRVATLRAGKFLPKKTRNAALQLRVILEGNAGHYDQAFFVYNYLKTYAPKESATLDEFVKTWRNSIDGTKSIGIDVKIVSHEKTPLWIHQIFRRSFAFNNIRGNLDRFELRCDQQAISGKVDAQMQWTVPDEYSNCYIYVYGDRGSSFQFVEMNVAKEKGTSRE